MSPRQELIRQKLIRQELAAAIFDEVGALTRDEAGVTREAYGEGEERAMQVIERRAAMLGLATERDRFQNLWLRLPEDKRAEPPVVIGSHLDSVPRGGNFDGLAGVVAGLLLLDALRGQAMTAPPLRVLALRGEESAFYGKACWPAHCRCTIVAAAAPSARPWRAAASMSMPSLAAKPCSHPPRSRPISNSISNRVR
jgi:hypothetical protein